MNKTCIFDLDGTLIDSLADLAQAGNYLMTQLNMPPHSLEAYKLFVGSGIKNLILRATPNINWQAAELDEALKQFNDYYSQHCNEATTIYPGIIELLDQLIKDGYQLAVVTNKPQQIAVKLVKELFGNRFKYVYGQVQGIPIKPDPTQVINILVQTQTKPHMAYYIGDSDVDIYTAKNAGISSIGCLWGNRSYEELKEAGAMYLVRDAKALYHIIKEQQG